MLCSYTVSSTSTNTFKIHFIFQPLQPPLQCCLLTHSSLLLLQLFTVVNCDFCYSCCHHIVRLSLLSQPSFTFTIVATVVTVCCSSHCVVTLSHYCFFVIVVIGCLLPLSHYNRCQEQVKVMLGWGLHQQSIVRREDEVSMEVLSSHIKSMYGLGFEQYLNLMVRKIQARKLIHHIYQQ